MSTAWDPSVLNELYLLRDTTFTPDFHMVDVFVHVTTAPSVHTSSFPRRDNTGVYTALQVIARPVVEFLYFHMTGDPVPVPVYFMVPTPAGLPPLCVLRFARGMGSAANTGTFWTATIAAVSHDMDQRFYALHVLRFMTGRPLRAGIQYVGGGDNGYFIDFSFAESYGESTLRLRVNGEGEDNMEVLRLCTRALLSPRDPAV
jgi:hypothetical protein